MIQAPKGTKDILPRDVYLWHHIEDAARKTAEAYAFKEIRTPVFEHTELFVRGVGDTTDIVNKEMYTFSIRAAGASPCAPRARRASRAPSSRTAS